MGTVRNINVAAFLAKYHSKYTTTIAITIYNNHATDFFAVTCIVILTSYAI